MRCTKHAGLLLVALVAVNVSACDAADVAAGRSDVDDAVAETRCQETWPLLVKTYEDTERYFVRIRLNGEDVALQLDTGSNTTFLFQEQTAPAYTPHIADADVVCRACGDAPCETLAMDGRNVPLFGDEVDGLPVVGLMGMSTLLLSPTLLDVPARALVRDAALVDDAAAVAHNVIAFDNVQNLALVPAVLDGLAVRLMFDTGGGHTLHVGVPGQPGDVEQQVVDAQGNMFPIFVGTGALTLGEVTRTVSVARAPAFPYFADTVAALGGNLHGLLGVTAFAKSEAIVVDGAGLRLLIVDTTATASGNDG